MPTNPVSSAFNYMLTKKKAQAAPAPSPVSVAPAARAYVSSKIPTEKAPAPAPVQEKQSPEVTAMLAEAEKRRQAPAAPPPAAAPASAPSPSAASPEQPQEKSALEKAYDAYIASLAPSETKTKAQEVYLNWKQGRDTGLQDIAEQPIAMPFISGQQASVERRAQIEGERLQGDVALEEERQKEQQAGLLAALGFQQTQAEAEAAKAEPLTVGAGQTLFDRLTGKPIYTAPEIETSSSLRKDYEYAKSQGYSGLFTDYQRDIAASKASVSVGATPPSYDEYIRTINDPGYAEFLATKKGVAGTSSPQAVKFQHDTANRVITDVDATKLKLNGLTAGIGGALMKNIPGTEAKNLSGMLDTLKANIGFGVLQDMRNASKTGGALGQISDRENVLLSSVLGSLDQAQSVEQLMTNLDNIKKIMFDWQTALAENTTAETTETTPSSNSEFNW